MRWNALGLLQWVACRKNVQPLASGAAELMQEQAQEPSDGGKMVSSNPSWEKTSSNQGCNRIWRLDSLRPSPHSTHMFLNTVHIKPHSFYMTVRSGVVWDWGCFSAEPSARLASIWGQMVFSLVRQLSLLDQLKFKIKTQEDTKEYKTHNSKLAKFTSERIDTSRLVWSWPEWLAVRRV